MDWSRLVGWSDPWSAGDAGLADAWRQCPDARWMFAAATYAGVPPTALAGALSRCVREIASSRDAVLDAADAYAGGSLSEDGLAASLPALAELSTWQLRADLIDRIATDMSQSDAAAAMAGDLATVNLLRALHPASSEAERAEGGANALGFFAALSALQARRSALETARHMLDEVTQRAGGLSLGALAGRTALERESSPSWDDSAQRAFAHALARWADHIRELVASPFAE